MEFQKKTEMFVDFVVVSSLVGAARPAARAFAGTPTVSQLVRPGAPPPLTVVSPIPCGATRSPYAHCGATLCNW